MHLEIAALQLVAFGYVFTRCAFSVFDLFGVNKLIGECVTTRGYCFLAMFTSLADGL